MKLANTMLVKAIAMMVIGPPDQRVLVRRMTHHKKRDTLGVSLFLVYVISDSCARRHGGPPARRSRLSARICIRTN